MYCYCKNQEFFLKKLPFSKNDNFCDFFLFFFQQRYIGKSWGCLRCNQCVFALHLSYQTTQSNDFQFFAYIVFVVFFFPPTPCTGGLQFLCVTLLLFPSLVCIGAVFQPVASMTGLKISAYQHHTYVVLSVSLCHWATIFSGFTF